MKKFLSMALAVIMACNFTFLGSENIAVANDWADYYDETWQLEGYDDEYVAFRVPQQSFKNLINSGNYKLVKYDGNDVIIEFHKEDVKEIIEKKPSKLWTAVKTALWAAYTGIIAYIGASAYYLINENLVKPNETNNVSTINLTDVNNKPVILDVTKLNISDINKMLKDATKLNLVDVNNKSVTIDSTKLLINLINNINGKATVNSATTTETNSTHGLSDYLRENLKGMVIMNNEFLNNQVSPMLVGNNSVFNKGINGTKSFFINNLNATQTFLSKLWPFGKANSSNTQQQQTNTNDQKQEEKSQASSSQGAGAKGEPQIVITIKKSNTNTQQSTNNSNPIIPGTNSTDTQQQINNENQNNNNESDQSKDGQTKDGQSGTSSPTQAPESVPTNTSSTNAQQSTDSLDSMVPEQQQAKKISEQQGNNCGAGYHKDEKTGECISD